MPEQTIRASTYLERLKDAYRQQFADVKEAIGNIPGSTAEEFFNKPGRALMEGLPFVNSQGKGIPAGVNLALGLSPTGNLWDRAVELAGYPEASTGAVDMLKSGLAGIYNDYEHAYSTPGYFVQNPMRPVSDALQLALPLLGRLRGLGSTPSSILRRSVIKRAGIPATEQVFPELFTSGNTATMETALEEAAARGIPYTIPQTTVKKPGLSLYQPASAAAANERMPQILQIQEGMLGEQAQGLLDQFGGNAGIKWIDEPGTAAQKLEPIGIQTRNTRQTQLQDWRDDIFRKAEQEVVIVPYEEVQPDGSLLAKTRSVVGPIQLDETSKVAHKYQDILSNLQNSFSSDPLLFVGFEKIIPRINSIIANPSATSPGLNSFFNHPGLSLASQTGIESMRNIYKIRQGLQGIRSRLPAGSPAAIPLRELDEAMKMDTYSSLNNPAIHPNFPGGGDAYRLYNEVARESRKAWDTPIGKNLSKESWEGITDKQIAKSPLTALDSALSDVTNFKHLLQVVGKDAATEALVYDVLKRGSKLGGWDWEAMGNATSKIHSDKFEVLGTGASQLKHQLGNFIYSVKAQNRLSVGEKASQGLSMRGDGAILNTVSGVAIGSPSRVGYGLAKLSEMLFNKHGLATIVSDPQAAYQAARLMSTPIMAPSFKSRLTTFGVTLGRLGVIGQARNKDGELVPAKFTETGELVPLEERRVFAIPP